MTDSLLTKKLNKKFGVLNNTEIYEILCKIKDKESTDVRKSSTSINYGFSTNKLEAPATKEQLYVLSVDLRYIHAPTHVDLTNPNDGYLRRNELEGLPWQVTYSGHRFLTIYEALLEANQRLCQLEEQVRLLSRRNIEDKADLNPQ
jgi:hypothetical protein